MIQITDITGIKYDVDEATRKYVTRKIGRLERYLPRHARKSASAEVKLKQIDKSHGNKYEAEIILSVPDKVLAAKDTSSNILATIDIVEAKLAGQLRRYKTETIPHLGRGRILSRFKRSYARESQ
ncbi:ribosomal subunit interface protein [Candidatus Saccharibacteria bacterium 32-50-13]|nr:MAG: ribosomal subunit interface protein [Candidatus Saccharibacteria bacterium 32-50-13]